MLFFARSGWQPNKTPTHIVAPGVQRIIHEFFPSKYQSHKAILRCPKDGSMFRISWRIPAIHKQSEVVKNIPGPNFYKCHGPRPTSRCYPRLGGPRMSTKTCTQSISSRSLSFPSSVPSQAAMCPLHCKAWCISLQFGASSRRWDDHLQMIHPV